MSWILSLYIHLLLSSYLRSLSIQREKSISYLNWQMKSVLRFALSYSFLQVQALLLLPFFF